MNVAQIVALHGRYRRDHIAIEDGPRQIAYGALDVLVRRIAARLGASGVGTGDLVALWLRDHPEHIAAILAVARLGAVVLPLDWRWTPAEMERAVARFPPRAIVLERDKRPPSSVPIIDLDRIEAETPHPAAPVELAHAPFVYALSSGTTGEPKVAVNTHEAAFARASIHTLSVGSLPGDRFLLASPLAYGAGRQTTMNHLIIGASVVMFPTLFEPEQLIEAVHRLRIDTLFLTPSLARALLALPSRGATPLLHGLRKLFIGGAAMSMEDRRKCRARLNANVFEAYASVSAGTIAVAHNADHDAAPGSVGRPTVGCEVEIVGESGEARPPGETGWLRVRGPGTASTMIGTIEGSHERIENDWVYPGDIGRIGEDGYIYLDGRSSEIIKRGGATIHAGEIERVLAGHDAVREAAVIGRPIAIGDEEVVAFVVLSASVAPQALILHCRRQLAPYKVPRQVTVIESMPRNASGKVVKSRLLDLASSARGNQPRPTADAT